MTEISPQSVVLVGAGGHARVVADILAALRMQIGGYVDPQPSAWLDMLKVQHMPEVALELALNTKPLLAMSFLGLTCEALEKRFGKMQQYETQGAIFPALQHPQAIVSPNAQVAGGVQIMPGAIINSHARIGRGSVINSGAIVEHDAVIGEGVHVAPGSRVLGGVKVGDFSYIGSGAVVVQNATVPPRTFVKALSVFS